MKNIVKALSTFNNRRPLVFIAGGGLLAGSVFSFGVPAIIIPFALLPLITYFSRGANDTNRPVQDIAAGISFFLPFHALVLIWFLEADVSGTVGMSPRIAFGAALFSWAVMSTVLTICTLPVPALLHWLRRKNFPTVYWAVLFTVIWVSCEWLRSIGFSVFLYGKGGTVGDYWNFGSLGLAFMDTPFRFISRIGGMYGLSFLCILTAVYTHQLFAARRLRGIGIVLASAVILSAAGWLITNIDTSSRQLHAASVLQQDETDSTDISIPIVNERADAKHIIVLPEYSDLFNGGFATIGARNISDRLAPSGISIDVTQHGGQGTMLFRDRTSTIVASHTKKLLIPTGEYLPAILTTFYNWTGQSSFVAAYDNTRRLEKGDEPQLFKSGGLTIGPVACSGILSRGTYRNYARNGAEVFTNSASLVIFNQSESYLRQASHMARFHAVANSRTYIQATKGAPAFVLDGDGNHIVQSNDSRTKFYDFTFHPEDRLTPYTRIGEWVLTLSLTISTSFLVAYAFIKSPFKIRS